MKGKLYGIGAGPGDPELLTVKAINAVKKCQVIAAPKTGEGKGAAFTIVEEYLQGKELLECRFAMVMDGEKLDEARQVIAEDVIEHLKAGKDVGFVTLGDPTTYSTYMYLHEIITGKGFQTEIIPGITSFAAAAAALGIPLCEWDEALTVIPVQNNENIDDMLGYPGNKVIMKSGKNLVRILGKLKEQGYDKHTKIASRVSMADQKLFNSISEYENSPETGYFTLAIVKMHNSK